MEQQTKLNRASEGRKHPPPISRGRVPTDAAKGRRGVAPASLGTSALRQGPAALTRTAPGVGVLQGERKANPGKRSYLRITSGWPYPDPMLGVKPLLKKEQGGVLVLFLPLGGRALDEQKSTLAVMTTCTF